MRHALYDLETCWNFLLVHRRSLIFFCDLLIGWCCVVFPLCMPLISIADTSPDPYLLSFNWSTLKGSFSMCIILSSLCVFVLRRRKICVMYLSASIYMVSDCFSQKFRQRGRLLDIWCWHHFCKRQIYKQDVQVVQDVLWHVPTSGYLSRWCVFALTWRLFYLWNPRLYSWCPRNTFLFRISH
jgi:hypothetical protein